MRVICHAQHLTGVGHFVIAHNLARGLAETHDVYLVEGGRRVPRRARPHDPTSISVPVLVRSPEGRMSGDDGRSGDEVIAHRAALLAEAAEQIQPDVVLVDHYPFSKWELQPEISALIASARAANPNVQVVASLRDIAPRTRFEDMSDAEHAARVVALLGEWFDGLLVHADPAFVELGAHFVGADDIPFPFDYTGFVTEAPPAVPDATAPWAVASGGGADTTEFLVSVIAGFRRAADAGTVGDMRLQVFGGLSAGEDDRDRFRRAAGSGPVDVHEFSSAFLGWLDGAALSINRAGYNTTAALLRSRVRSVIVPGPRLSDQRPRALRMADAGVAVMVDGDDERDADAMADAIVRALAMPRPEHHFDLDGVATTRRLLEARY
jgi:predicted glycosyltransferase